MKVLIICNLNNEEEVWFSKYFSNFNNNIEFLKIKESGDISFRLVFKMLKAYKKLNRYDVVVTFQDGRFTFLISLLNSFFRKRYFHIVHEFITSPLKPTLYSYLKYKFLNICLNNVDTINCSSRKEIVYYIDTIKIIPNKFKFIPLATDPKIMDYNISKEKDYIISVGRTGRDYKTLIEAIKGMPLKLIIVCDKFNLQGLEIPGNVHVECNIPFKRVIELISYAKFLVVPLENTPVSTGQRVIVIGMALGKAVIVSRTNGTIDYVNKKNGISVEPYDSSKLRSSICYLLNNPQVAKEMGSFGRRRVQLIHHPEKTIQKICNRLNRLQ